MSWAISLTNLLPEFGVWVMHYIQASELLLCCKNSNIDNLSSGSWWNQAVWNGATHSACSCTIEWQATRSTWSCSKACSRPVLSIPQMSSWCPVNDRLWSCWFGFQAARPMGTVLPQQTLAHYGTSCASSHMYCYLRRKYTRLLMATHTFITSYIPEGQFRERGNTVCALENSCFCFSSLALYILPYCILHWYLICIKHL